ncbi:protein sel-1 homolog 3-like [Mercenaria mercenaria]|uniref:protein sel-1 homolog 3-like n=1 Tax=Mercenaria mercenaria TaxID=6596 RepID=UPI00234F3AE8|nr:protein sel-1 homolog 3-like [Mercenaria mercenaria]
MYIYIKCFIFMIGIKFSKCKMENPKTMSVVINKESSLLEDYIQIKEPLATISGAFTKVTVEYRCTEDKFVGVEVVADTNLDVSQKLFQKVWRCHKSNELSVIKLKKVKLKLPPEVAYNYNAFNKHVTVTSRSKVRIWMLDNDLWSSCFRQRNCYTKSSVKVSYDVQISPPFSRPYYKPYKQCKTWGWDIVAMITFDIIPTCPCEEETIEAIKYPVVLGGDAYGVYRQFRPYNNPDLERTRQDQIARPMFTLSIWLYILEYCRGPSMLCSIMHHFTWNGQFKSIMLLLTPEGRIHIQIENIQRQHTAGLSYFSIPKNQWVRLILQFQIQTWRLVVNYGENFKEILETEYRHPGEPILYDDAKDLFTFGGSEYMQSFKGYIGQATIYRNKIIEPRNIPMPSKFHPMFELKLTRREEKCSKYLEWVSSRITAHKDRYIYSAQKKTCRHPFVKMVQSAIDYDNLTTLPTCKLARKKNNRYRKQVDRIVKKMVSDGEEVDFNQIADLLYQNATAALDERLDNIRDAFPVLKQAACYGNMDAMYTISVILNNGIYIKADEIQSQAYLMLAALDNHRLAALALGHKHRYGTDGVTEDWEQSYRYYKFVADTTNADKERHKDTDVYTESIRLTDEVAIHEQTDEDGDIFHWLTFQAKQGVLSAQNRIGRALFWGQQGLKRNLATAVEYFKMSAETGDAQSQYDYGIVLLRGQGVKKTIQAGLMSYTRQQSENPAAINAIVLARMHLAELIKLLSSMSRHIECNPPLDKALNYFMYAAARGQMDAGVAVAFQTIKGTSRQPRNVYTAVEWARFIAEKNPSIGLALRKALHAYRKGKSDVSLFYYALAADAGLEVGSFNNAWLCEENKDGITSFIEKECVWSRYNLSTQREPQFVDPYALLKMGDYYWYGCEGVRDSKLAASYYAEAAKKHDPQALFNLGFMIEEGVEVPRKHLRDLRVPERFISNNITLLEYLYTRCKDSHKSEAYVPCSIALWRVQALAFWTKYQIAIKITSFTGIASTTALSVYVLVRTHLRSHIDRTDSI